MELGLSKKQLANEYGLKPEALYRARRASVAAQTVNAPRRNGGNPRSRRRLGRADGRKRSPGTEAEPDSCVSATAPPSRW